MQAAFGVDKNLASLYTTLYFSLETTISACFSQPLEKVDLWKLFAPIAIPGYLSIVPNCVLGAPDTLASVIQSSF
jgi:hypothetical protein